MASDSPNKRNQAAATALPRKARAARLPAPALPIFEALDHEHQAALQMLRTFDRLLEQLERSGLGDDCRASAQQIMDFFNGPGLHHHALEEQHVFPGLLASTDVELVQHVRRLQQDHGWIEEDWRELAPQVEAISMGYNWYDLEMLQHALPVFNALYQDHIALEELLVYPAAKRQQQALLEGQAHRRA